MYLPVIILWNVKKNSSDFNVNYEIINFEIWHLAIFQNGLHRRVLKTYENIW